MAQDGQDQHDGSIGSEGPLSGICTALISQSPVSTWIADRDGLCIYLNRATLDLLGIQSGDQFVGKYNIFQDEVLRRAGLMPQIRKVFEEGGATEITFDYDLSNVMEIAPGSPGHVVLKGYLFAITDSSGQVGNVVAQYESITDVVEIEQKLEEEKERFKALTDNATDLVVVLSADGAVCYTSPSLGRLLGYSPDEVIGSDVREFIHPDDMQAASDSILRAAASEGSRESTLLRIRHKDGSWRYMESHAQGMVNHPSIHGIVINSRDVTENKQAEMALRASEGELRALISAMRDVVLVLDSQGRYVNIAPTTPGSLLYRPPDRLLGRTLHQVFPEPQADEFLGYIRQALGTGETVNAEYRLEIEGREAWFYAAISPMSENEVLWVARDITSLKLTEARLRMTIDELSAVVNASPIAIVCLDLEEKVLTWNTAAERIFGWSSEEVIGRPIPIVPPDQIAAYQEVHARVRHDESLLGTELPALQKDGTRIFVSLSLAPMHGAEGEVIGSVGLVEDVTERVTAQEQLAESESQFRTLAENANAIIGIVQDSRFVYMNPYFERFSGYTHDEIMSMDIRDALASEFRDIVVERARRRQMGLPEPSHYEFKMVTKSGEEKWLDFSPALITYKGQPAVVGVAYDITDRKRAEQALQESEARMKAVIDSAPYGSHVYDLEPDGRLVFVGANRSADRILGVDNSQFIGKTIEEAFPLLVGTEIPDAYRRVAKTGEEYETEQITYDSQGIKGVFEVHAFRIGPNRVAAFFRDITERRKAEEALRDSEARYRLLFDENPFPMWLYDPDTLAFIEVNDAAVQHYGYSRDEFLSMTIKDIRPPEDVPTLVEITSGVRRGLQHSGVWRHRTKDGRVIFAQITASPIVTEGRRATLVLANDVTERQKAEEALRESEARYRELVETMNVGLAQSDADYLFTYVNTSFANMLGHTAEEMIGHRLLEFVDEESQDAMADRITRRRRGEQKRHEMAWRAKDGRKVYTLVAPKAVFDDKGVFIGSTAVLTDITARVEAGEKLRESEERLARTLETAPSGIVMLDRDGAIVFANSAAEKILGVSRERIIRRSYDSAEWHEMTLDGKPLPAEETPFAIAMRTGASVSDMETAVARASGEIAILSINAAPLRNAAGEITGVVASLTDITERKQAQQALEEAESKYRTLVEQSLVGVYMIQDGKFVYVNPEEAHILGYSEDELIGMPVINTVAPESRELVEQNMTRRLSGETQSSHYVFKVLRKDGRTVDVEVLGSRTTYNGRPAILGTAMDITERKRAELALRTNEALLRQFVEHTPAAIAMFDKDMRYLLYSRRWLADYRLGDRDIKGLTHYEVFPDVPERWKEIHQRALAGSVERCEEDPFVRADGRVDWIRWEVRPWRNEAGEIGGIIMFTEVITERKRAEDALRRSEENFRALFDSMPAAVFSYDRNAVILQVNPAFQRLFGFAPDQAIGRSMFETIARPQDRELTFQVVEQVFSGKRVENVEWQDVRPDGLPIYVLSSTTPVYSPSGEIVYALSMGIDITERKEAAERASELEEHKREFYRCTILAATEGKLEVTERQDILRIAGPPIAVWDIRTAGDLSRIRQEIGDIVESAGMDDDRACDFILAVGEATTNAYKHAGGGTASLHRIDGCLVIVVSDQGKGMEALALPELAFTRGYTTAKSLGMGYKAILSVADKVYLSTGPSGTTVAIEMSLLPAEKPVPVLSLPDTW